MDYDEMIQEVIRFSKTCPNCGIVEGLVMRETEDKTEWLCPKCGAVRFYSEKQEYEDKSEWKSFYGEPPIEKK